MSIPLATGDQAPEFELTDHTGTSHRLSDCLGRWVVLYFYPKDDTPGCTLEACQFRDHHTELVASGAIVWGISTDSPQRHARFRVRHALPFSLLSDADGKVSTRYGTLFRLGPIRFSRRHSFLIDPTGHIARIYRHVKPTTHAEEILNALRDLQAQQKITEQ